MRHRRGCVESLVVWTTRVATVLVVGCAAETPSAIDTGAIDTGALDAGATDADRTDTRDHDAGACAHPDQDGDGNPAIGCGGTDCDDTNPNRRPGLVEVCDVAGVDEDCDPTTFGFRDADGDGVADAACCNHVGGDHCGTDCNDAAPGVGPTAPEVCNHVDDDCDTAVDETVTVQCWLDADMDGFAVATAMPMTLCACTGGTTATSPAGTSVDCDDTRADVSPGVPEVCGNGRDDNCDGHVDTGSDWFADCDSDGFGDPFSTPTTACTQPGTRASCPESTPSWSTDPRDCDDHDATVRPGAIELCNGVNDDCNTATADGANDPSCAPGTGVCIGGACCTGCVQGGACQGGTMPSSCGGGGGACGVCSECVACNAGVCGGPASTGACGSGSTTGTCVAGTCCTGCVDGGACVAGDAAGACGFEGNVCSLCPTCSGGVCGGGDTCTDYIDVSATDIHTYAIDTCALTDTFMSDCAPAGTRDAVLSGVVGGYLLTVEPGWSLVYLTDDGLCVQDSFGCNMDGFLGISGSTTARTYFGVERTGGGCGRVTITVNH